jgi:hypothetical protein
MWYPFNPDSSFTGKDTMIIPIMRKTEEEDKNNNKRKDLASIY